MPLGLFALHTTPLGYLPDGDGRVLVIASAGGAPKHPAWYHNLVAHPRVTVEAGAFTYEAQATALEGPARDRVFARAAETGPGWSAYQAKTDRGLPVVVVLEEIPSGPPNIRADSPGAALKAVHDGFRRELALIREETAASGPGLGTQLRVNCLSLCQCLHNHHTGEDAGMFPLLDRHHPELGPALARMREEHEKLAVLLAALQKVVSAEGADPQVVRAEVERLTAEVEDHLRYEEEQLIPVLDGSGC